jgi:hypothetical protein
MTKAGWLPYFAMAGIPDDVAWKLMPVIGVVDIVAGLLVLFAPHRAAVVYMVFWASWTALLQPLAGESVFEAIEPAGNYGVPLALLLCFDRSLSWRTSRQRLEAQRTSGRTREPLRFVLLATVVLCCWTMAFLAPSQANRCSTRIMQASVCRLISRCLWDGSKC